MALGENDLKRIVKNPTKGKQVQHNHEKGLCLRESATDNKLTWQGRYMFEGKRYRIDYGNYPQVSLANAVKLHNHTRQLSNNA